MTGSLGGRTMDSGAEIGCNRAGERNHKLRSRSHATAGAFAPNPAEIT